MPALGAIRSLLTSTFNTAVENRLRRLVAKSVPAFDPELVRINIDSPCLHMEFVRHALRYNDSRSLVRALQLGEYHASFPLLYEWNGLSSNLRKYVLFCFLQHSPERPTLPLIPCPRLRLVEFAEWLPGAGITVGWKSIRHYVGAVASWNHICGYEDVRRQDKVGWDIWQRNFEANVHVQRAPRGGDFTLRPSMLQGLAEVCSDGSPASIRLLMAASLLWFTALRPGHLSPNGTARKHVRHLMKWEHLHPYTTASGRAAIHVYVPTAKTRRDQQSKPWSTAFMCICCKPPSGISSTQLRRLRLLCPVCAINRWHHVAPASVYVCVRLNDACPVQRNKFNTELRDGLRQALALSSITPSLIDAVVVRISVKSIRSGAITEVITEGIADFVAADFAGHTNTATTQTYYNKAGDAQRFVAAPALTAGLIR